MEKLNEEIQAIEKKASSVFKEFRDFINKGNMLDLAIGVVIGAAFTAFTNSFMTYLVNPLVGLCTGGIDFGKQYVVLKTGNNVDAVNAAKTVEDVAKAGGLALGYGAFITAIINFLVVMFVMFIVVKAYNKMKKPVEETPAAEKPDDVILLEEIRDLLKSK